MNKQHGAKRRPGFTLMELVVVTALSSILGLVVAQFFTTGSQAWRRGREIMDGNEKTAEAVRDIEKYSRGTTEVIDAGARQFIFLAYIKGDIQPAPSKISFYVQDDKLKRSIINPVVMGESFIYPEANAEISELISNLSSLDIFTYYNEFSAPISIQPVQPDVVRMIKASVSIDKVIGKAPETISNSTYIQLRNTKTNL